MAATLTTRCHGDNSEPCYILIVDRSEVGRWPASQRADAIRAALDADPDAELAIGPTRIALAARTLGRIKTPRKTAASRKSIVKATAASPHSGRPRSTYYEAVAQHSGQDAGIVCSALTREACRELAHQRTTMSVRIRRVRSTPEAIAALKAVGKL